MSRTESLETIESRQPTFWNISGSVQALSAEPSAKYHPIFGHGLRLRLPQSNELLQASLDLYPDRFVLRYRSDLARLDLLDVTELRPIADHVQAKATGEAHATECLLYPDGSITLATLPLEPIVSSTASDATAAEEEPQPAIVSRPEGEPPERVVLTGRLGRNPQLRETVTGKLVARLPLAVHQGEQTVWHNVLFFDAKAKEASEQLAKGQLVMVIGYRHFREVKTRTGETKVVEEIYGASMQLPNSPR